MRTLTSISQAMTSRFRAETGASVECNILSELSPTGGVRMLISGSEADCEAVAAYTMRELGATVEYEDRTEEPGFPGLRGWRIQFPR